jgi:hypothetical protein
MCLLDDEDNPAPGRCRYEPDEGVVLSPPCDLTFPVRFPLVGSPICGRLCLIKVSSALTMATPVHTTIKTRPGRLLVV